MASHRITRADLYPDGTLVTAYPASNWSMAARPPSGAPVGSSEGVAGTMSSGAAWLLGLTEDRDFYAYGLVGGQHRYVSFKADSVPTAAGALSKKNGQPGMIAPSGMGWFPSVLTLVANQGRISRFVPSEDMLVRAIGFAVSTAAGADDPCDVALYDATGARIAASAITNGKLNSIGPKEVLLAAPTQIKAGNTYYGEMGCGAIGGTAAVVMGATPGALAAAQLFGATIGLVELDGSAARHPAPSTWAITGASGAGFMLAIKE